RVESAGNSIDFAAKVYSDLTDATDQLSPAHMLEALANRFGIEIEVGAQRSHFIWATKIPVKSNRDIRLLQGTAPKNHDFTQQMYIMIEEAPERVANCALCFCLDLTLCAQWGRSHRR